MSNNNMISGSAIGGVFPGIEDEWKTQAFRSKVVAQIEDEVRKTGSPITKTSIEMENHVFQNAKNRDEYLAHVARLMIHMRDTSSKKEGALGKIQQQMGAGGQDPMSALQGLTSIPIGGARPGQQGTPPLGQQPMQQMIGAGQQHSTAGQLTPQQRTKQIQLQLQKQLSGAVSAPATTDGFVPSGPQQGMIPQQSAAIGQQIGAMQAGQGGQLIRGQQQFKQIPQQIPNLQGPGSIPHARPPQEFQQQQPMTMGIAGTPQPFQQQQQQQQQLQQQQLQQLQQQQHLQQLQHLQQQRQQQQQRPPASPYAGYSYMSPQSMSQQPSPASHSQGSQPMPSPASYLQSSLSPQQASSLPSPAGSQRGPPSVPSPGGLLNTPGNPVSVGPGSVGSIAPVPSPGKGQGSTQAYDQQAYYEKWKQLSKYIEPLKRMINKASKDEENRKDMSLSKMNNLMEILSDPNKKVQLSMLLKCEQVLERMGLGKVPIAVGSGSSSAAAAATTPTASKPNNICTPLYQAIMLNIESPALNHSLQRTFGPSMAAIHGPPMSYPSPPPAPQKMDTDTQTFTVPNIIQGEVARLPSKFRICLDENYHLGGNDVHLVCRLEDKRLPSVPPISVTIPHSYPAVSPHCDTGSHEYNQTPFLSSVQRMLVSQLMRMTDHFSLTQMLDVWEMCVRKSCLSSLTA